MSVAMPAPMVRKLSIGDEYRNTPHDYYHRIGGTVMSEGSPDFRAAADAKSKEIISSSPRGSKVKEVTVTPHALEWTVELDQPSKHAPKESRFSPQLHHVHHEAVPSPRVRRMSERSMHVGTQPTEMAI